MARHRWHNDSAMSPLVISASSSSTGAGCHGTDVAEASSVCLSPDRSAPGSSGKSMPERGQSTSGSTVLAGPSMVLGLDLSLMALHGKFQSGGNTLTGVGLSPPPRDDEVVGVVPEGAQLILSSLSTEVAETIIQSRVETFHFMVRRPPARPSQLPDWYSSGVPAGPSLRRVDPLHLEGLCSGNLGLPHLSWWAVSGQKPPSYTFPP